MMKCKKVKPKPDFTEVELARAASEPNHHALVAPSLDDWWQLTCERDLEKTLPKAIAYGSKGEDMVAIGRQIAMIGDMTPPAGVTEEQYYAELGCHFYLVGKLARAGEAFKNGLLPSADTLFDTTCYSMMHRRIRDVGHWG